jgi:hypothetical protein
VNAKASTQGKFDILQDMFYRRPMDLSRRVQVLAHFVNRIGQIQLSEG